MESKKIDSVRLGSLYLLHDLIGRGARGRSILLPTDHRKLFTPFLVVYFLYYCFSISALLYLTSNDNQQEE